MSKFKRKIAVSANPVVFIILALSLYLAWRLTWSVSKYGFFLSTIAYAITEMIMMTRFNLRPIPKNHTDFIAPLDKSDVIWQRKMLVLLFATIVLTIFFIGIISAVTFIIK